MAQTKPTDDITTAPNPAPTPDAPPPEAPPAAAPAPQVIVQMVENKAAAPTAGLSETTPGGKFGHNGKFYDAYLTEIK